LTAFWLEEHDIVQSGMRGLADLESDLHECATAPWRILSLGHNHVASVHNLCTAFNQESHGFAAAVVGGHGHRLGGVKLADGFWRGDGADLSRVDLLVLVACAVGRLRQWSDRDVEGLYASLAACGARSVIAARWDVDDQEAAAFTKEVVTEFMKSVTDLNESSAYCRAAALNRARKRLLTPNGPMSNMGIHVAAAFELYGAG
jgi:hypothetical protein